MGSFRPTRVRCGTGSALGTLPCAWRCGITVRDLLGGIKAADEWRMSPGTVPNVVFGTFTRGTKTYRAALLLADRGYGEQAGMLNRSLFEHAVVAWWLLLQEDDEVVMERIRAHREHAQVLYERHSALHPELALDDEKREEATESARTEWLSWTGCSATTGTSTGPA
jgi:Family of unknown function (DUF5677)